MNTVPIEEMIANQGKLEVTSDWVELSQDRINIFADATLDHQFIHIDEERAKAETPFGGTIAHGFLTLSMLSHFLASSLPRVDKTVMGINYGFEKVRFLMPVPSGSKIRGHTKLAEVTERKPGEFLMRYECSIEIENVEKPALVAEWLGLTIVGNED